MEETIMQEHTFVLERAPGVGYGIAISGGRDNPGVHTGDPSIVISDVIPRGPASDKLKPNDIVLRVNGKPMFNIEHSKAIKELKNSGQRVELTIRRKVVVRVATPPRSRSRSRDLDSPPRSRYRSRSRDLDDGYRRHRSRSRDLDSDRFRDRPYRRSRSRTPPRRNRSRSPSYSRRRSYSRSRSSSPSNRRGRSRTPPRRRNRSRSRSISRSRSSFSRSSRSSSPDRRRSPVRLSKHKSVEDLRSTSPLAPDPDGMKSEPGTLVFPVKKREPNTVVLKKTRWNSSYGLKLGTRIFIQDIQRGSLADKSVELSSGDTVLMINGRNVDNKTVQEAIQIIGLSKDKVTMLVKKEDGGTVSLPASRFAAQKSRDHRKSESEKSFSSRKTSTSQESEKSEEHVPVEAPVVAPKPEKKQYGGIRVLPTLNTAAPPPHSPSTSSSSSARSSPEPAPRTSHPVTLEREYSEPPGPYEDDGLVLPPTARQITFKKERSVGIRLTGGNDVGIFVASVQEGSPAARQGLKMGDQILSVNDNNFRNIIREEAILTLMGLSSGSDVRIVAQAQPEAYKTIQERGTGDSFYIRTHFKYDKNGQHELSFRRGSTFRVFDTLYQGMVGYWLAARYGRDNKQSDRGVIPNSSRAEQLKMVQDKKIASVRENRNRGIGRRFKNQKSSDTPKSSSTSAMFPAYERVVLREAGFKRPVVIFGPLADIARQRLAGDYPDVYEVAKNEGVVSGQKSNRKGVIRLNTIKDVIETDKHAILDITPNAVEKLNYAQLYPIVVYLEAQSKAVVKDLRGKLATSDEERKKKPGKLYDRAVKLQRGYHHVFTDSIKLFASSDDWYRKLHATIKDQQSMPVWVSEDKLGGAPGDGDEGVMIPGDDDQLSYVSAPASDYSVTTVGSDMLNTSRISDEEESRPKDVTRPKPPSSTSSSSEEGGEKFDDGDFDDALVESDEGPPPAKPVSPPAEPQPMHEEPRERQPLTHQPRPRERFSSTSSSSEEEPAIPTHTPKAPAGRVTTRVEPPRGKHEIPAGRFDPNSFLNAHIGGRKATKDEVEPPSDSSSSSSSSSSSPPPVAAKPPPVARQPYRDESPVARQPFRQEAPVSKQPYREEAPVPAKTVTPSYNSYNPAPTVNGFGDPVSSTPNSMSSLNLVTAKPFKRPEPQQPVYSTVNKVRPSQPPLSQPDNRRESAARDYAKEIDSFISADPYKRPTARDDLRTRHVSPPQPKPSNSYNRFAGSSQLRTEPKPYQPYSAAAPRPSYQHPQQPSNGMPQKSKFVQENYKDYVSQIKQPPPSTSYSASRPYTKPPVSKFNNGVGSKENLYDSGVDIYDSAKPRREPVPVSPSSLDDDDPQVVATARGVFDSNGGVLSSVETGVSIVIPKGAIRPGVKQEIYFKVCRDNTSLPPLDKNKGETLLSPLVMCGPHGLQFDHPVELRLPHCASMTSDGWSFALKTSDPGEPSEWHNVGTPNENNNYDVGSNSVSVLIDHF